MNSIAQIISWVALGGTLLPSCLLFAGMMDLDQMKVWTLVATIVWFVLTPLWMEHKAKE
jgi:hypothetical protein